MLFNKSIVSFVAAITLATSVTASAIPPPTGTGKGTDSPNQVSGPDNTSQGSSQAPTCSPGLNPMCCDAVIQFGSLSDSIRSSLKTLDPTLNENYNVGQQCASPVGSQGCGTQLPLCCDAVQSADGLPKLAPSCVNPTNST